MEWKSAYCYRHELELLEMLPESTGLCLLTPHLPYPSPVGHDMKPTPYQPYLSINLCCRDLQRSSIQVCLEGIDGRRGLSYPNRAGFSPVEGVELKPDFRFEDGRLVVRGVIVDTIVELIADAFLDRRSLDEQENDL